MPKHEPWHKPRKDEDADDQLLDWLGGGGNGKHPHPGGKPPNRSCTVLLIAMAGGGAAVLTALGAGIKVIT